MVAHRILPKRQDKKGQPMGCRLAFLFEECASVLVPSHGRDALPRVRSGSVAQERDPPVRTAHQQYITMYD